MLLTQKAQPLNLGHHHRRHPASLSNIAVVSHPTPGLLSLSKPQQRLQSRHPQRAQSNRFSQRNRIQRPTSADLPSPHLHQDLARGRSTHNKSHSQPRSSSQSDTQSTAVPVPVPAAATLPFPPAPAQQSSTPEAPILAAQPSGRLARTRRTRHKSTPAAALISNPELERRAPSPVKQQSSAPIPVPKPRRAPSPAAHKVLSRSDPLSKLSIQTDLPHKGVPRKDKRRRNRAKRAPDGGPLPLAEWDFPAPGSSDDDDDAEGEDDDEPSTPVGQTGSNDKAWQRALFNDGPKTAPLQPSATSPTRAQGQFPFFQFPPRTVPARTRTSAPVAVPTTTPVSTPRRQARPDHRRAPSQPVSLGRSSSFPETMFHLSEDEAEALPAGADVREKMALLFGNGNGTTGAVPLFPGTGTPSPSPRRVQRNPRDRESVDGVARQLFASSSFQLAPEPMELPKPSFLLGVRA